MKQKIITILAIVLFMAASILTLYPLIGNYVNQKYASEIQTAYQEIVAQTDDAALEEARAQAAAYNLALIPGATEAYSQEQLTAAARDYGTLPNIVSGCHRIPHGFRCRPPEPTSLPIGGENTNCILAGHRGYNGAKYFRFIELLEVGDLVTVTNLWETLNYRVCEIQIIDPTDVDAVLIQQGRDLLTLLTCHPYASGGKERYLVFCERI